MNLVPKSILALAFAVLLLPLPSAFAAATSPSPILISSCGTTISSPGTYELPSGGLSSSPLPQSSSQSTPAASFSPLPFCILIDSSDVSILGGSISGEFSAAAIIIPPSGYTNIHISSLSILNTLNTGILLNAYNYSLGMPFSSNVHFSNLSITSADEGIWILGCHQCSVESSSISPTPPTSLSPYAVTPDSGIILDGTTDFSIRDSSISPGFRTSSIEFVDLNISTTILSNHLASQPFAGAIGTVYNGDLRSSLIEGNLITSDIPNYATNPAPPALGIYWSHNGGVSPINQLMGDEGIEFYGNRIIHNTIDTPFCLYFPFLRISSPLSASATGSVTDTTTANLPSSPFPMWNGSVSPVGTYPRYSKVTNNDFSDNQCTGISYFGHSYNQQ